MRRHLIRLASASFTFSRLAKFGGFPLPCATPGNEAERKSYGGWVKSPVLFKPVCGPKFTKFLDDVGVPSWFSTLLPDCLCHVSFRIYSQLSLELVEKPNKCGSFLAQIFGREDPTFLRQIISAIYHPPFGKVWFVPFAYLHLRSLAMK